MVNLQIIVVHYEKCLVVKQLRTIKTSISIMSPKFPTKNLVEKCLNIVAFSILFTKKEKCTKF